MNYKSVIMKFQHTQSRLYSTLSRLYLDYDSSIINDYPLNTVELLEDFIVKIMPGVHYSKRKQYEYYNIYMQ